MMSIYRRACCLPLCLLFSACSGANQPSTATPSNANVWVQQGFADFHKGHFDDAGVNAYVSAAGKIEQIHRWDLNEDGNIDLVFANTHAQSEKLDAAIYWGNGNDFTDQRKSYIPNEGAQWTIAADLDGDGKLDAVVPSYTNGTWSKQPSRIYFSRGGSQTRPSAREDREGAAGLRPAPTGTPFPFFPFASKIDLPTQAAQKAAVADLNRDGYPDIIFAMSAGFWEYRGHSALASPSRIFWGSKDGFSPDHHTDLEAAGACDVAVADLNRDGWPDIVLANRERGGKFDVNSCIYWGGKDGFSIDRRTELPTNQVNAVAIGDINRDGYPDIVFANGAGSASYVYLNQHGQFDVQHRVDLPSSDARGCAIADLNADGWPDLFITNFQTDGNNKTLSYLYWGAPNGFSPSRRQEFQTVGAWGVSIGDLNGDGRPDIVVSNFQDGTSFDPPSYIYWNSRSGFSDSLRTSLFTHGAVGNTIADFNGDGHPDVIFNNTMSGSRGGPQPSFVYWGNDKGDYSARHRQELPTVEPYGWGAADLNDDGWPDLIFANEAETGRHITENFIYWGGKNGFSTARRSAFVGDGSKAVNMADLDGDGYLDLVVLNSGEPGLLIYWGGPDGFVTTQRTSLPSGHQGFPAIADLNGDGHLDIVVAGDGKKGAEIYWGEGTRNYSIARATEIPDSQKSANIEIADINRDGDLDLILTARGEPDANPSYIYYGNGRGDFSADRRCRFLPVQTQGVTVADVNRDGWLDVICPCYEHDGSRKTMSRIYFGGPGGLNEKNILELPTYGGTGSMLADFNHDGYPDLLLTCHRFEGDPDKIGAASAHVTNSFLYWGGPDGFKPDRKLLIPTRGAHYDCGIDLGNIYDRRPGFDYISTPHHYGNHSGARIEWTAQEHYGRIVKFQIRTAASESGLNSAKWVGPEGEGTYYTKSGSPLKTPRGDSWIQYRARFTSPDGADSAVLKKVILAFE